jgi:hypothetical protein
VIGRLGRRPVGSHLADVKVVGASLHLSSMERSATKDS